MTPAELSLAVLRAVHRAVDAGELSVAVPARAVVAPPGPGGCGDYATNVALQLARPAGRPSRQVAEILRPHLTDVDGIAGVEISGPGFLNITLDGGAEALVRDILRRGGRYGYVDEPSGRIQQLHYPCEVRAAVSGQVLAGILRSQRILVRTSCETELDPAWAEPLGVTVDAHGRPGAPDPLDVNLRPVPAPEDPTPLGRDAARWALLHPAPHHRPRITAEHLVQRESNPLFRVRYAHARTQALSRNAADLGFGSAPGDVRPQGPSRFRPTVTGNPTSTSTLTSTYASTVPSTYTATVTKTAAPATATAATATATAVKADSTSLLTALADYPPALATAANHHSPDRLARQLVLVADAFLRYQEATRILPFGDEKPSAAHRARLALAEAAGTVLAGGLSLLGIDAPEHL
uniref:arginine--tRNA ligase n=1 Tax=uncultured bacterium esnapd26 TaxID=1366607 RepID=S5UDH3_9BACT|nr:arginyl-tRNA synthetase [uncultured bacterium esnapd26]